MTEFIFKKSIARIFIITGIFFSITAFSNKHTEILVDSNFSFPLEKTVNKSIENIAPIIEGNRYSNFELLDEDASVLLGLSGKVFEDINYGGGNGRTYAAANASAQSSGWTAGEIAVENAIVELYDGAGNYISNTTTDATGGYTFTGIVDGTYQIRVVNNSVASNRGSNSTGQTIVPVQTFRTNGTSDVLNEVGGRSPNLIDAAANTTGASLSTLSTSSTDAQSVTLVNLNDTNTTEVNFGYNFDTVVNTNDSGQGSLRQFVLNSNELTNNNLNQEDTPTNGVNFPKDLEWETSIFMIPGSGLHKIDLSSELALIRDNQTHITGYTQQGSAQGTNANRVITIEIDGNTVLYDGLRIFADDVQISGLSIHTFRTSIYSYKNASTNTFIWGNYIGTEADGETIASTFSGTGISLYNVDDSFIGTNGDNVNDANEGNVVSNSYDGISIRSTSNVLVAGNYVGTDKTGSIDLGNRFKGIFLRDPAGTNIVGFDDTAINTNAADFRNVSSGNGNDGIRLLNGDNQVLAGNYLGTDATGTFAITNVNYGIQIQGNVNNLIIGTDSDGDDDEKERNVMSGNGSGMRFLGGTTGTNNRVSGNFIGTDATGNIAVPNLNNGLNINGPIGGVVVGTNADGINDEIERNVISGNGEDGIRLSDTNDNLIAGNNIGVAYNGLPLGNEKRGILIATSASYNTIGYSPTMTNANELVVGNNIKYNDDSAVAISDTGVGNRISRNQFDANEGIGIDLDYDLVTANDNGDGDSGPNELLNFPVFESSEVIGNDLVIFGYAPAGAEVEFFLADNGPNPNPLPSDYTNSFGEGAVYLFTAFEGGSLDTDGSTNSYVDDGTGATNTKVQNRFRFTIDTTGLNLVQGTLITSTATNTANSTSEFSGWTEVR
jgi:parallel beta-helix repeat protein